MNLMVGSIFPQLINIARPCLKILEMDYCHFYSKPFNAGIDKKRKPISWFTYQALEYIKQLELSEKILFEYSCRNAI